MAFDNVLLFGIAVFPLVCTPGPDVLFIASQGLTAGKRAVMIANAGILTGYCVHAILSALGVAALVAVGDRCLRVGSGVVVIDVLSRSMLNPSTTTTFSQSMQQPIHSSIHSWSNTCAGRWRLVSDGTDTR